MYIPRATLETDVADKRLVYVSEKKLEQFLLDTTKRGFSLNFPGGPGVGIDSHEIPIREQINAVGRHLESTNQLTYEEVPPRKGSWLLVRMRAVCGTAWAFEGGSTQFSDTAWWVGESERLQIFAYGHRAHLLGQGKVPVSPDSKATWWPSRIDAYKDLLTSISLVVEKDDLSGNISIDLSKDNHVTFRGLKNYFFQDRVRRDDYLEGPGPYEALLRVDGIEENGSEIPIVYGSPLWVAAVTSAVPGTYLVDVFQDEPGIKLVASWDGTTWSDLRFQDERHPLLRSKRIQKAIPDYPCEPPNPGKLISLSIREETLVNSEATNPSPEKNSSDTKTPNRHQETHSSSLKRFWSRFWSRIHKS